MEDIESRIISFVLPFLKEGKQYLSDMGSVSDCGHWSNENGVLVAYVSSNSPDQSVELSFVVSFKIEEEVVHFESSIGMDSGEVMSEGPSGSFSVQNGSEIMNAEWAGRLRKFLDANLSLLLISR